MRWHMSVDLVILGVTFDPKMTFEKLAWFLEQLLKEFVSWRRLFHDRSLLGRYFRGFVLPVLEYCSAVWCSAANTHFKLLDRAVSSTQYTRPLQFCVCCIRSGVTRCTRLMIRYLDRMWQCGLHTVLWIHIGILMRRLAGEPCSTAGLSFPSQCPSGMILLIPYSMVWDWRFQE